MKYTPSHEWIRMEGASGVVGITSHAKEELGDIVHIELPKVGASVKAGEEVCVLESTKSAADLYAPVSGKVVRVNESLKHSSGALNSDPEATGWLYVLELSKPKELDDLLTKAQYERLVGSRH